MLLVIPFQCDAAIQAPVLIFDARIVGPDGRKQIFYVLEANIFKSKNVNYKGEGIWLGNILPEVGGVSYFIVAGRGQPLIEGLVGKGPHLR